MRRYVAYINLVCKRKGNRDQRSAESALEAQREAALRRDTAARACEGYFLRGGVL